MRSILTIIFLITCFSVINAQHYTHDIGVFVSSNSLQSDYGQRSDFESEWNNNGLAFSVAHYLHFFNRTLRWDPHNVMHKHLMVKTELEYLSNTKLEHHGTWANKESYGGEQLRAMKGTLRMFNIGVNLEYYLRSLESFIYPYSDIWLNPFFTFGFKYSFYTNGLKSELGEWQQDIAILPQKYTLENALDIGPGQVFSFNIGLGTRFKLTEKLDISAKYSYQYFFSDKVDGLQAKVIENKNNEWAVNIQFGLVYHLNFSLPLFY